MYIYIYIYIYIVIYKFICCVYSQNKMMQLIQTDVIYNLSKIYILKTIYKIISIRMRLSLILSLQMYGLPSF